MVSGMGPSMNVPCIWLQLINISLDNHKKKKKKKKFWSQNSKKKKMEDKIN